MSPQLGRSMAVGPGDGKRLVCWVILGTKQQRWGGWTPMLTGARLRLPLPRFFLATVLSSVVPSPSRAWNTEKSETRLP